MSVDTIFFNAYVPEFVLPKGSQRCSAISIKNGRVHSTGDREYVFKDAVKDTNIFDLRGNTLLPGFTDSHVHLVDTGLEMVFWVDLSAATCLDDVFSLLLAHKAEKGDWITASGFDQAKLAENRFPTRKELDQLPLNNPIFIRRRDGHSSSQNSIAFDQLIGNFKDLSGIEVDASGQPTGILRANAHYAAMKQVVELNFSKDLCKQACFRASELAISKGVTTIHALMGGTINPPETVDYFLDVQDHLPIRTVLWNQCTQVNDVVKQGLSRIGGCIMLDGAVGSHSAALFEPYNDAPETSGTLYNSQEEINTFIQMAHNTGLQIAIHAIGDKAIEQALEAFEIALQQNPRDHRHRIEHFLFPLQRHIEKTAELGIIVSTQPAFEYFWGGVNNLYGQRLGEKRVLRTHPLKSAINLGVMLCGGSDSFVTPINPLLGIHAAINHPNPEQRISLEEACKMFTVNPPFSVFEENDKGLIAPGYLADLVILGDKLADNVADVKDVSVVATFIGGELRYENNLSKLQLV